MAFKDDLEVAVRDILRYQWHENEGRVIPDPENVGLGNRAVHFKSAAVLYADLSSSTGLVDRFSWHFAAEMYKSYLYCAAHIIRNEGGDITAYDGDRIMGIFIGEFPCTNAARCGLRINWAVRDIINPAIKKQYPSTTYIMKQTVGIDVSELRAARTGVRGDNDLVWVGRAANYAAKLTTLDDDYPTWITKAVFDRMKDSSKYSKDGRLMWEKRLWTKMNQMEIYRSNWSWAF
jgi:class 3 adenylate cyclase